MKNSFGNNVTVTLLGESHGGAIGAVLDGMAPGIPVDERFIVSQMAKRRSIAAISTARKEPDKVEILSGVFEGKTTGTPITFLIRNENTQSSDYSDFSHIARPGHADYTGYMKFGGYNDYRGGGHFSGRITAGLVAAGVIALSALSAKGISIATHISRCGGISDRPFGNLKSDVEKLNRSNFAVLDDRAGEAMMQRILAVRAEGDSVGGVLESIVTGLPAGVGEPWFDTLEGVLSHVLLSIPGVKGIEFGDGFALADMTGSQANDSMRMVEGKVVTDTDRMGGIFGGISAGMPLRMRIAVKPTPSVYKTQKTVDFVSGKNTDLLIHGRHDPAIIHRCRVVADSCIALALCDLLSARYGTLWLSPENGGEANGEKR